VRWISEHRAISVPALGEELGASSKVAGSRHLRLDAATR
jgi:hypothetical protein